VSCVRVQNERVSHYFFRSSPRAETFKTPGGTTKRKSFQALPAIHDEDVEIMENRATGKGESLVLERRTEADSQIVITKVKDPLDRSVIEQDYLYGSVGRQAETESSKDVEEKLEHKLRQMLERHSTKVSKDALVEGRQVLLISPVSTAE